MSTITLPNIRVSSDLTVKLKLKDGGVALDWSTLQNIKVSIYSDAQRALAGRCGASIYAEDPTLLVCTYAANKPQYVGVNRVVVSAKYMGETKTYDKPAFSFVRWTSDQEGEEITIDDPDVDVEITVEDVSSSILQEAVDAAFSAADRANEAAAAAEHMVDIHTGPEGKSAYEVAVEEGYTGTEEEWLASLKGPVGETPDISIGTVTTVEPGTPAAASMTGTPKAPVLNLSIPKGLVGATPNFTVGTVTTGEPGSSVIVTITGTPEAPVLNLTIPQGMQGNTGSSVDYPYELVNNLTTNDATKGLSAAQGVVLAGQVSQLQQEADNIVYLTGMESNISIPLTASGGIDPDAVSFPCFIKAGIRATFTLQDPSGIIGNNSIAVYKIVNGVRSYWFDIRTSSSNTKEITENIDKLAFYAPASSVSADGTIAINILQEGKFQEENGATRILAARKVERLAYIGIDSAEKTDWVVGDKIYNTTRGTLAVCTSPSPNVDFGEQYLPSLESVYIYDGKLYIYDGTTLVPVSGADEVDTDALELAVNGNFSKSYDMKAGVDIDGTSASSPYAIPLMLGEGESYTIQRNTSAVSNIATYAIKADGSTQFIAGLYNNNVRIFSAPVDMVALGVYIPGSSISADGTYTLTVAKTPLWQTQKDVTGISKKVGLAESANYKVNAIPSDLFDQSEFIIGDNWHGNIDTSVKYRVSMASIHTADRDLYLSVLDGYSFALDLFVSGAYSSSVPYRTSPYKIPQGTEYVLKIAKYPEDTSIEADLGLFVSQIRIQSEFQQAIFGKGFVGYYGQRVPPLKMQKNYQCDENVLISQTMPSDGNNANKNASGLVVYGNRIFSFNDGATCSVFALDTLELLQVASLPWSAHNNNAQPTPYFYDSGDTYPLFLVSRGDYAGSGEQKFYFVRVVESSGSFTFTIVKEVSYSGFPGAEYNCSWFANYERGELYCYSYTNGGWSVAENNPIIFHKFTFPSLDNYDPVTLTDADVKETITLQDHWIMQSGLYHNGKIFIQVEGDSTWDLTINGQTFDKSLGLHWLFVINAESGYVESYVPLYGAIEQEGMCIYDGELYMSEKYTTATVGNICYRLVKYKF